MTAPSAESMPVETDEHVVRVRQAVRAKAIELGFSLVEQTKVVTAASELARNAIHHGGGGRAVVEVLIEGPRRGLRLTVEDDGPGIADIGQAMKDGFTTGGGLGLGLAGARRLSSEFEITSAPGRGTRVVIVRWK